MEGHFPKIGMRIIKTAVAVLVCLLIDFVWHDNIPLYSTITAILCMQPYLSNSRKVAANRMIGCIIGGIAGMVILTLFQQMLLPKIVQYGIISLMIIPLIYITLLMKRSAASAFTCIVFLSTTLFGSPDAVPFDIAASRTVNTLIGILVALVVNSFHMPLPENRETLFVSDLDDTLTHTDGQISTYTEFQLNKLLDHGIFFTIVTDRTPATFLPVVENLNLRLPVIAMNGAVLYDTRDQSYSMAVPMARTTSDAVERIFEEKGCNCFVHAVINETMHIYYGDFRHTTEEKFYHRLRRTSLKNYIYGKMPEGQQAVCITAVNEDWLTKQLETALRRAEISEKVTIVSYPYKRQVGYSVIEIYSAQATREEAVRTLKDCLSLKQLVAFGSSEMDRALFQISDRAYAVENADEELRRVSTQVIGPAESDAVVRMMEYLYHHQRKIRKA